MSDWNVLVVHEPGGRSAVDAGVHRFAEELRSHLQQPVELVEQPLSSIDLTAWNFLLVNARNVDAALAVVQAAGVASRTIALEVSRTGARGLVERQSLLGAIPVTTFGDWQHNRFSSTGRGLWGRLDIAARFGATVIGGQKTERYGLLEGPFATLPALVAAYLTACATAVTAPAAASDDDEDIRFLLSRLTTGTTAQRALTLRDLAEQPSRDARVVSAIAALLDDRAACLLGIPFRFGELRLLAATALAAERRAAGDHSGVELTCIAPQTTTELMDGFTRLGLTWPTGGDPIDAAIAAFEQLRARDALAEGPVRLSS